MLFPQIEYVLISNVKFIINFELYRFLKLEYATTITNDL